MGEPTMREIKRRFPAEGELRRDASALGYHALLLGAYVLCCHDLMSPGVFMVVGLCAYIRNFNTIHESSHARPAAWNPLRRLRQAAMIVHGPLQLGRSAMDHNHRLHHAFPADPERDPGASVNCGRWPRASLNSFIQPELALVAFVRGEGRLTPAMGRALAYNVAVTAGLVAVGGAHYLWWLAVTRLGSTAAWFVFDWVLHHPTVWGRPAPPELPRWITLLWSAMFSRDNLNASRFHGLHHCYPRVADRALPALAEFLARRARTDLDSGARWVGG